VVFWNRDEKNVAHKDSSTKKNDDKNKDLKATEAVKEPSVMSGMPQAGRAEPPSNGERSSNAEFSMDKFGKVRSALGSGTVIQGKLSFDTPVRIDGKLSGEIFSSNALIVGESGIIEAQVEAASLIILGKVKGTVKVTERIELHAGGVLEGDIQAPTLVIHNGAQFNGNCSMGHNAESLSIPERKPEVKPAQVAAAQPNNAPGMSASRDKADSAKAAAERQAGFKSEVRTH
jgi:cytoskeletal protein CcmA (bactofilin family)